MFINGIVKDMKIIVIPEVEQYLESLKQILFEKEYFGFEDTAQKYVDDLFLDIKTNLPTRRHVPAPPYFDKYGKGMYYAAFRKSKRTVWSAFFTKYQQNDEVFYLVRYIANNHVIAQYLEI